MNSIGIDIGYSTLKLIVLNNEKKQIFKICTLHHGNTHHLLKKNLNSVMNIFNIKDCYIGFIGEHSKLFKKYHLNDISALTEGALYTNKNIKSIIEIGAQSSKYITGFSQDSKSSIKFFMNSSCSAGTGSFLDEQVSRLGIKTNEFSDYIKKATKIPRIAGRCSVFSKTDMIHHQQEGARIEDILLGLSYALARNYKANIVQRTKVEKPVMFVGGVANNIGVVRALKDIFKFSDNDIFIPDSCSDIGALGAALLAENNKIICNIKNILEEINKISIQNEYSSPYKSLQKYGTGDSIDKHLCKISNDPIIEGHIGVDIGSTSTNVVLIDKNKDVLAYRYIRTQGDPEKAATLGINSIKEEFHNKLDIKSIGTTGSGRSMIGKKIGADLIINEITAQARGAIEIDKDVDTIFEIGGQDSKYIKIDNGKVIDFEMNKICAAGTGSFIEEQAKKLKIPIEKFENIALKGNEPLCLGDKCTVFIEGNISKAIAEGKSKENITAGLGYSIVNNYLNRVVGNKTIGNKIFLQGGIAHNQAIINAFKSILKKEIIIPKFFSVTGAYGVALLTKEHVEKEKSLLDLGEKNVKPVETRNIENEIEKLYLKDYTTEIDSQKLTIGIPRILFMHKLFPMFNEFFKELGFNVILTGHSDKEITALSQEYSLDETCYPIKLINGHVAKLINQGVDYIFLPSLYTMKHPISKTREDYACVYMQSFPQIVSHVMDLENRGIKLLSPALSFKFGKKYMMETLLKLGEELGKNKLKTTLAIMKGIKKFKQFENEVEQLGEEVLENLKPDEKVFVIITRAYGVSDRGLNMEIPNKLRAMGYKVLTLSNLPAHSYDLSEDYPNMYWPFGQHILSGARIVKETKNLYAIYLTNHGCGPDTILSHYFKEEMKGKPYLHLEVDEHASNIGVLTRLEAFVDSLKTDNTAITIKNPIINTDNQKTIKNNNIESYEGNIYIPNIYPYSNILQMILIKKGINAKLLSYTSKESLEIGKKESISKEYLSLMALMGDIFSQLEDIKDKNVSILIPQDEGSEVFGQYSKLLKQKINSTKFKNINIESPFIENLLEDENYGMDFGLALIAGDLVMSSDKKNRDFYLNKILNNINSNSFDKELLIDIANNIYIELSNKKYNKSIYVLGELSIIFNPLLNNQQIEKLENKNKIYYMPVSEMMYFKWMDYLKKQKIGHKKLKLNLKTLNDIIIQVSKSLKEYSPFDKNLNEMFEISASKLPLYCGGNGRYRMIKQFRCSEKIDGILTVNSMYENTGTILKLLKDKYSDELKHPIIDLCFDGSEHSDNNDKIENFIYYI